MQTQWRGADAALAGPVQAGLPSGGTGGGCIAPTATRGRNGGRRTGLGGDLLDIAEELGKMSRRLVVEAEKCMHAGIGPVPVPAPAPAEPGLVHVHGLPEITAAIRRSLDEARHEILTAQPDGPRPGAVLDKALAAVRDQLAAGVSMRTLYQHSTRFDEPTKEYVRVVSGYGAQIRTLAEFFDRLIVVDRTTAFIPASPDRTSAVIVTEPAVVKFLVDIFERAWDRAESYPFLPVRAADAAAEIVPDIRNAICKLLIEGRSDREIARRLGFSLRSLQSHVARLKDEFGAQHRLQLGYLMGIKEAEESKERARRARAGKEGRGTGPVGEDEAAEAGGA